VPDFMHVNLYPLTVATDLSFVHLAPAFAAADAGFMGTTVTEIKRLESSRRTRTLCD
jgi:hypothetical protein